MKRRRVKVSMSVAGDFLCSFSCQDFPIFVFKASHNISIITMEAEGQIVQANTNKITEIEQTSGGDACLSATPSFYTSANVPVIPFLQNLEIASKSSALIKSDPSSSRRRLMLSFA